MPLVRTLTAGFLGRRAARGLGRFIPNPVLRFVAVSAVTALVPLAVERLARGRRRRHRIWRR